MITVSEAPHETRSRGRLTIVYLIHEAFLRDLARLSQALRGGDHDAERVAALRDHWDFVCDQLRHHHTVEDVSLWPIIRPKLVRQPEDLAVLDDMEAEHHNLEPRLRAAELSFSRLSEAPGEELAADIACKIDDLAVVLGEHLDDEERRCFPIIDWALSYDEFEAFGKATAKAIGVRGSSRFFPWIFDGADPVERNAMLRMLPLPARLLCGYVWEPRYRNTTARLWSA